MDEIEIRPQEGSEAGETSEQAEIHALDDATFSPGDSLEQVGDFRQAEAIQTSLETVMASIATEMTAEAVGGLPIPIPRPEDGLEIHQVAPLNNGMSGRDSHQEGPFEPAGEDDDDDRDNITPINLPGVQRIDGEEISQKKETPDVAESPLPATAGEQVGFDPVPLPHSGDEISVKGHIKGTEGSTEMPLPGTAGEQVGFNPIPIPRPEDGLEIHQVAPLNNGMSGRDSHQEGPFEPAGEDDDDRDNITPINLPGIQRIAGEEISQKKETPDVAESPLPATAGEQVGFDPIPLPHTEDEISAKGHIKGTEGSTEMPLPGTAGETGYKFGEGGVPGEEVSATPITLPDEADLASSAGGVAGSGAEGVGITPINLPREADLASSAGGVAGSGAEGVGITPINLPREANVVADGIEGGMGGSQVAAGGLKGPGGDGVASGAVKGPGGEGVASGAPKDPGGDGVASAPVPQPVPNVADGGVESFGGIPAEEIGMKWMPKEPGGVAEIPLPGVVGESKELDTEIKDREEQLNTIGDDAQLADIDLQNVLEEQQQIVEMLSRMSQNMSDTAQGVIRNMKA